MSDRARRPGQPSDAPTSSNQSTWPSLIAPVGWGARRDVYVFPPLEALARLLAAWQLLLYARAGRLDINRAIRGAADLVGRAAVYSLANDDCSPVEDEP